MKSCLLSILIIAVNCIAARNVNAQCVYKFSVDQDTYTPLSGSQSLNDTNVWDDVNYKKDMGFSCEMDWTEISKFSLVNNIKGEFIGVDTTSLFNGFCILDADLDDRGKVGDTVSKSSIRYLVDLVNGKKVLKIEYYNAGFWRERDLHNTMDDSVNLQVWVYEATNVVELRYGPSKISHASEYFVYGTGGGPVIGFVRDGGLYSLSVSTLYYLRGNPASPTFDSCGTSINNVVTALDSFPTEGTVYRFTPLPNSIDDVHQLTGVKVVNTVCDNELIITNELSEPIQYEIISLTGSRLKNSSILTTGVHKIDISSQPNGIYVLKLFSRSSSKTIKFIKI